MRVSYQDWDSCYLFLAFPPQKRGRKATRVLNSLSVRRKETEGWDLCPWLSRRMPREERRDKEKPYSWPASNVAGSKTVPATPVSYYPCLCNPLPLSGGGNCDLPVTNRIRPKWQDMWLHHIRLYRPFCYEILSLAGFEEASCQVMSCLQREPGEGSLQLTVNKQLRAHKRLNSANNHMSSEENPSPVKPHMRQQPCWHLDCSLIKYLAKSQPDSWLTETVR